MRFSILSSAEGSEIDLSQAFLFLLYFLGAMALIFVVLLLVDKFGRKRADDEKPAENAENAPEIPENTEDTNENGEDENE